MARLTVDPEGGLLELLFGPADQLQGVGGWASVKQLPTDKSPSSAGPTTSSWAAVSLPIVNVLSGPALN